jgi:hypothetical protein
MSPDYLATPANDNGHLDLSERSAIAAALRLAEDARLLLADLRAKIQRLREQGRS